jgi:signal peptidase I
MWLYFGQPKNETVAFIKRIVGLPGDRIQVTDGVLRINDVPVSRSKKGIATATDGYNVIKFVVYEETLPNGRSYVIQERSDNDMLDNTSVYEVPAGALFHDG